MHVRNLGLRTALALMDRLVEGLAQLWGLVTGPDTVHTPRITFPSQRDVQHSSYCPLPAYLPPLPLLLPQGDAYL